VRPSNCWGEAGRLKALHKRNGKLEEANAKLKPSAGDEPLRTDQTSPQPGLHPFGLRAFSALQDSGEELQRDGVSRRRLHWVRLPDAPSCSSILGPSS